MNRMLMAALALGALALPIAAQAPRPMLRGLWVDSWGEGFLAPEQTEELVATARAANINALFVEVRKVGDAYYLGGREPRASNIAGPPDYDPLQHLIDLCHDTSGGKQRIEVHAWMVTFRVWRSSLGEPPPGHILHEHPETIMSNASGETEGEGSMFADPGHPITEDWTVAVFRDVAERYDVDGLHHDYVRYPEYEGDWGHNPVSLARFRARTGFVGTPAADDPAWREWRREQVRATVRRIYGEVMEANPRCLISAATTNWALDMDIWRWYESRPRNQAMQDWVSFMQEGILDMNCLMSYANAVTQPHRFSDWNEVALRSRLDRHAIIGPGIYMNTVRDGFAQIREAIAAGADGVLLYSYGGTNRDGVPRQEYFRMLARDVFTEPVPLPSRPWRDTPNVGAVIGQVTDAEGKWVDGATVTLDGVHTMLTDGTGFFAFFRLLPGEHAVRLQHPAGGEPLTATVTVAPGRASRADFQVVGTD